MLKLLEVNLQIPEGRNAGHYDRFKWKKMKRLADEKLVDAAAKASRVKGDSKKGARAFVKDTHVEVKQKGDEVDFKQAS